MPIVYPCAQEAEDYMIQHSSLDHLAPLFPKLTPFFNEPDFRKFLIFVVSVAKDDKEIKFTSKLGKDLVFYRGPSFQGNTNSESNNVFACPQGLTDEFHNLTLALSYEYTLIRELLARKAGLI
jgi:hypothetical protein